MWKRKYFLKDSLTKRRSNYFDFRRLLRSIDIRLRKILNSSTIQTWKVSFRKYSRFSSESRAPVMYPSRRASQLLRIFETTVDRWNMLNFSAAKWNWLRAWIMHFSKTELQFMKKFALKLEFFSNEYNFYQKYNKFYKRRKPKY